VHLLDSIIAFAAILLAASLMVTAGTQVTIALLGLRGANLRRSLTNLFEGACDDRDARRYGKVIASRVLRHPLLSGSLFSRLGIRAEDLPFVPADAAGKLRWAGDGIPFQPWLLGALGGFLGWPAILAAIQRLTSLDICSISSAINSYVPFLNFCEHPWRTGAIAGAILGGLLSRWRLATTVRCDELVGVLEKLATPPGGSLPDPAQRAMLVIAGQAQSGARSKTNSTAADFSKFVRELQETGEEDMDAAQEKTIQQVLSQYDPRVEGLNSWFDHAMARASQRFTMQARIITVSLSLLLVFAAHFDAIRLFRMLSSDAQVREQLAASSDALTKQAGQLSRTREDAAAKEVVPDIYRKAMVDVLQLAPVNVPAIKPKSAHSAHRTAATAQALAGGNAVESAGVLEATAQTPSDGALFQTSAQPVTDAPATESTHKSSKPSKTKPPEIDPEKSAAIPAEDRPTMEVKARAGKALQTTAGFASREDAVSWLRATLNSDPALENLIANYQQAVNAQLVSDADKLLDRSASLKHDLARSELQLIPENWTGWHPTGNEWPGFLVSLALLSLGATICYNLLKTVASLRPLSSMGPNIYPGVSPDRRIRRDDRRNPQTREQARPQTKPQIKLPDKKVEDREPVTYGPMERLL